MAFLFNQLPILFSYWIIFFLLMFRNSFYSCDISILSFIFVSNIFHSLVLVAHFLFLLINDDWQAAVLRRQPISMPPIVGAAVCSCARLNHTFQEARRLISLKFRTRRGQCCLAQGYSRTGSEDQVPKAQSDSPGTRPRSSLKGSALRLGDKAPFLQREHL